MYEELFGLKRPPFRAQASGADVFVGPQTAAIMKALKKALAPTDATVAVTGAAGVGKTTLVKRAIDNIDQPKLIIRIARMQLGHDEVLEFLLDELDAEQVPKSTIKQIALFRDLLAKLAAAGTRVIIVVEDAARIGEDALAELEALTATDGEHGGANLVMMGDASLPELLATPSLTRLNQRTRLRHPVLPLSASELLGYMKHCFRLAGGEFDLIFAAGSDQLLFELTQGNPRVANVIVESVLTAAGECQAKKIDCELIRSVATEQFGLSVDATVIESEQPEDDPQQRQDESDADAIPELIQDTLPDLEVIAPGLAAQGLVISPQTGPPEDPVATSSDDTIPTLFDSTKPQPPEPESLPQVTAVPKPEIVSRPEAVTAPEPEPEPESRPAATAIPERSPVPEHERVELAPADSPTANDEDELADWERDPTLAQLKPDLEALEQAMAAIQVPEEEEEEEDLPEIEVELKDPTLPGVPAITLDSEIELKFNQAQEALKETGRPDTSEGSENPAAHEASAQPPAAPATTAPTAATAASPEKPTAPATPAPAASGEKQQKAEAQLEKIAADLARAKTIEDVDDKMAETLFGEEINLVAAHVVSNAPESKPANDDIPDGESAMEREFKEVYGEDALEVSLESETSGGLDLSASQRLATVRALNADKKPQPAAIPIQTQNTEPAPQAPQPDPIEDQINTSMTQTLKALNVRPPPSFDDDDDEKSGFFSRFKRS